MTCATLDDSIASAFPSTDVETEEDQDTARAPDGMVCLLYGDTQLRFNAGSTYIRARVAGRGRKKEDKREENPAVVGTPPTQPPL